MKKRMIPKSYLGHLGQPTWFGVKLFCKTSRRKKISTPRDAFPYFFKLLLN